MTNETTVCDPEAYVNTWAGIGYIVHGTLYLPLYLPCMIVMMRAPLIHQSCFKIMVFMGCTDLLAIFLCCHVAGSLSLIGAPSCEPMYFWLTKRGGGLAMGMNNH